MIEIDGKKYATTAWERDFRGLPPSPALLRKSASAAKGGKKSRRGSGVDTSPVFPDGVPPEDRGPNWTPDGSHLKRREKTMREAPRYEKDEQGILVRKYKSRTKKIPREQPLPSREEVFANLERQMSKEPENK